MKKRRNCYECGQERDVNKVLVCPRCDCVELYDPKLHDPDYDFRSDASYALMRVAIALGVPLLAVLAGYMYVKG